MYFKHKSMAVLCYENGEQVHVCVNTWYTLTFTVLIYEHYCESVWQKSTNTHIKRGSSLVPSSVMRFDDNSDMIYVSIWFVNTS